ncbi:MAG: hypothetical protein WC455_14950 [Dehalococcoidia bacterium]
MAIANSLFDDPQCEGIVGWGNNRKGLERLVGLPYSIKFLLKECGIGRLKKPDGYTELRRKSPAKQFQFH